jgi:hypothetical protein
MTACLDRIAKLHWDWPLFGYGEGLLDYFELDDTDHAPLCPLRPHVSFPMHIQLDRKVASIMPDIYQLRQCANPRTICVDMFDNINSPPAIRSELETFFQHQMAYLYHRRPYAHRVHLHAYWMQWLPVVKCDIMRVYPDAHDWPVTDWSKGGRAYPQIIQDLEGYPATNNLPGIIEFVDAVWPSEENLATDDMGNPVMTPSAHEAEWGPLLAAETELLSLVERALRETPVDVWKGKLRFGISRDIKCDCAFAKSATRVSRATASGCT